MKVLIVLLILIGSSSLITPKNVIASELPFIGEVMIVGGNYCPKNWVEANGQVLDINQFPTLYSLLGDTYGGDGRTTFAIPDLRGRETIHTGQPGQIYYAQGVYSGNEFVTLGIEHIPAHSHDVNTINDIGIKNGPGTDILATPNVTANIYYEGSPNSTMNSGMIGTTGGSLPLKKQSPYLTMKYCLALNGIYPSRN